MDDFDRLLSNLKIISRVSHNGKLKRMANGMLTVEDSHALVPLRRLWFSESRRQTLQDLIYILKQAFDEVKKQLEGPRGEQQGWQGNTTRLSVLCRELKEAQTGLCNLRGTYQDDLFMVVNLDLLIEKAATSVQQAEEQHPELVSRKSSTANAKAK
jgi:hypothetical protein